MLESATVAPLEAITTAVSRQQRTLKKKASSAGIGVHTGVAVSIQFCPAVEGTGLVFRRIDLCGKPEIPAKINYVQQTTRSTTIGVGDVCVTMIEHALATLRAYQIDNLYIDLSAEESPMGNGSANIFVEMVEEAGIVEQSQVAPIVKLTQPVFWSKGDVHLVALPYDGYKVSYTLSYPQSTVLRAQYHSVDVDTESFKKEIAPCRTFSLYEEVSALIDSGLIKGGSLDNAVVVKDDEIINEDGLVFPDEMVRHKILDLIGDLSLVGFNFHAHVIAIRSGHTANCIFAEKLYKQLLMENG